LAKFNRTHLKYYLPESRPTCSCFSLLFL